MPAPPSCRTVVFVNLYKARYRQGDKQYTEEYQEFFYEDVFQELSTFGHVVTMFVTSNVQEHICGNVYATFVDSRSAHDCVERMRGRWYDGRVVVVQLCGVADIGSSRCWQSELGMCHRTFCNMLHVYPISVNLRRRLYGYNYPDADGYLSLSPRSTAGTGPAGR